MRAATREDVLTELVEPLVAARPWLDRHALVDSLREREHMGSTAMGNGVAIPHGKAAGLESALLVFGRSREGVAFSSSEKDCHIFFLILAPEEEAGQHLRLLAQIARRAKDPVFRSEVLLAGNREQLWRVLVAP